MFKRLLVLLGVLCSLLPAYARPAKSAPKQNDRTFRVGTYNIRVVCNEKDSTNNWASRKARLVQSVRDNAFDVFGVNECTKIQQADLIELLGDTYNCKFFSPYSQEGTGKKAQGIIYKKEFTLSDWHYFWLADNPDVMTTNDISNHGRYNRGACCAILTHNESGIKMFFMVTHGPLRRAVRDEYAPLFAQMEKKYNPDGYPSFFVGDMNAKQGEGSSTSFREYWKDTFLSLSPAEKSGPGATHNGFNLSRDMYSHDGRIDYIYYRNAAPLKYVCNDTLYDGHFASDHFPIYADFKFEANPGLYRKLKKSVTWDNLRAHPAPLPISGELQPRASSLEAPSIWSAGVETLDRDYADFKQFRRFVGQTGVGYGRLQSGWAKTEQKKGKYDFSWLDEHVDGLIEEGVHPWMCLCYGNPVYSNHGHDLDAQIFPDGPIMDAWLRYVKAIVKRYKGKVTMWEVWNEPDNKRHPDSYPQYANLFVRTAQAIREIDPEAKIAAFAACTPNSEYIRKALKLIDEAGGIPYIDYITYHAYWKIPETVIPAVKQLREDVNLYNPSIELLQGETGCPGQLEYGHALANLEWDEYSQAKWDLRQAMAHFGMGIPYSFFTMVDLDYGWMQQSFGLIRMNGRKEPVYLRPKFYAVQHVTRLFTPEMKATDKLSISIDSGEKLTSFGLEKGGKLVGCVLWLSGNIPSRSLERHLRDICIDGMGMKDPVYVDLLTGYIHELKAAAPRRAFETTCFKDFPIWDSPVVIIERSAL